MYITKTQRYFGFRYQQDFFFPQVSYPYESTQQEYLSLVERFPGLPTTPVGLLETHISVTHRNIYLPCCVLSFRCSFFGQNLEPDKNIQVRTE